MSVRSRALALVCLAAGALGAQNTGTGTIPAHATVSAVVTISNPTPLEFGSLLAGQTSPEVQPQFSATSPHAGSIEVQFSDPVTLNVTIDPGGELSNGGKTLTTVLSCGIGTSATDANTVNVACEGQHFNGPVTRTVNTAFVFVGGHTTAPSDAPAGAYTGTITVRVTVTSS
jgi:hypothetical protein